VVERRQQGLRVPWVHESENKAMVLRVQDGLFGARRERFLEG
jgi:hypothetical protein